MSPINLDALMRYDLDVSAKETGKVLAVVSAGGKRNLTIVDLKSASLWTKIQLWWHDSLSKRTIRNFLSENMTEFSEKVGQDRKARVHFETQCAKLSRKIRFTHSPAWNLTIKFEFPDIDGSKKMEEYERVTFDRLTRKEQLVDIIGRKVVRCSVKGVLFDLKLIEMFKTNCVSGDYSGPPVGAYLLPQDEGKDREMTVRFSDLNDEYMDRVEEESLRITAINSAAPVTAPTTEAPSRKESSWCGMRPGRMSAGFFASATQEQSREESSWCGMRPGKMSAASYAPAPQEQPREKSSWCGMRPGYMSTGFFSTDWSQ